MAEKKAHLIGICGAGMSAVAYLLQAQGYDISGSDEGFYPPVSDYLKKLGLDCMPGYRPENIPEDATLIVIGKNAKLVPETNPEVALALDQYGEKVRSFPEVLAALSRERERLVVAGSYGKSTLTSIITWCLIHAGRDPGYFIGAIPNNFETSSALGTGPHFIFEGDEYPSANWDDRSKFLHYDPDTVILTSACHDHVNIYPTLESYHIPFAQLLVGLERRSGLLVACLDEENAAAFYGAYQGAKAGYGSAPEAEWRADNIRAGEATTFTLLHQDRPVVDMSTQLLGRHNVQNITGAAAWLLGQGVLTAQEFARAISAFEGIARRLDRKKINSQLIVYEGFGSSYEKARAAIEAIRDHFRGRKLTVLFEPHTFTWRNRNALSQYETAFDGVDRVWLYAPPVQGSDTHEQLTLDEIRQKAAAHHADVRTFNKETYTDILKDADPEEEVFLILSSGSFDGLLSGILKRAETEFPT